MTILLADVLRVEDTASNVSGLIRNKQLGISNTTPKRIIYKTDGGAYLNFTSDEDDARAFAASNHNHGLGTIGTIPKYVTTSGFGNSIITESSSKIGINATPLSILEIDVNNSGTTISSDNCIKVNNSNTTTNNISAIALTQASATTGGMPTGATIAAIHTDRTGGSRDTDLTFSTINATVSEKMRITADGNIGIGINNPTDVISLYRTASNPSISFQSGVSSRWHVGMGNDSLHVSTGTNNLGSIKTTWRSTGEVGVGTTIPASILHVSGNGGATGAIITESSLGTGYVGNKIAKGSESFWMAIENDAGNAFNANTSGAGVLWRSGARPIVFVTNSNEVMRVSSSGTVGILNTTPGYALDVEDDVVTQAKFGSSDAIYLLRANASVGMNTYWDGSNYRYGKSTGAFWANSVGHTPTTGDILLRCTPTSGVQDSIADLRTIVKITPDGKMGVGVNYTPSETLDVSGNGYFLGGVNATGVIARNVTANRNAIETYVADSGFIIMDKNLSASNSTQFYLRHRGGGVELGNCRGDVLFTSGNVLIGKPATPETILQVSGIVTLQGTQSAFVTSDVSEAKIFTMNSSGPGGYGSLALQSRPNTERPILLATSGIERMRITGNADVAKVGINERFPSGVLAITNTTLDYSTPALLINDVSSQTGTYIKFRGGSNGGGSEFDFADFKPNDGETNFYGGLEIDGRSISKTIPGIICQAYAPDVDAPLEGPNQPAAFRIDASSYASGTFSKEKKIFSISNNNSEKIHISGCGTLACGMANSGVAIKVNGTLNTSTHKAMQLCHTAVAHPVTSLFDTTEYGSISTIKGGTQNGEGGLAIRAISNNSSNPGMLLHAIVNSSIQSNNYAAMQFNASKSNSTGITVIDPTGVAFSFKNTNSTTDVGVGQVTILGNGSLVMPKASGTGMKVDTANPTFGWRDITADIHIEGSAVAQPTWAAYTGVLYQYQFTGGGTPDQVFVNFHIPHDYVPGTNMYIHTHWSNNTASTGNVQWNYNILYASGHGNAGGFADQFQLNSCNISGVQGAPTAAYGHMIQEVQFTNPGGTGGLIDSNKIAVDGVLICRISRGGTGSADTLNNEPFMHYVDLHYQSSNLPTKNKSPGFYD